MPNLRRRWLLWGALTAILIVPQVVRADATSDLLTRAADWAVLSPSQSGSGFDVVLLNLSQDAAIALGYVDPNTGQITGGQYVLHVSLKLGAAPLALMSGFLRNPHGDVISVNVDRAHPRYANISGFSPGLVLRPSADAVIFHLDAVLDPSAPIGQEGEALLQLAVLSSPRQPLRTAPKATSKIHYFGRDQNPGYDFRTWLFS